MKISSTHILIGLAVVGVLLIAGNKFLQEKNSEVAEGKYTQFASCLQEKGAKFYGAFWCPHCQEQKKLFGDAATALPYVECSTPDKQNQTQACIDAEIKSYPTWKFADTTTVNGVMQLETLAEKTGCTLPL
jgi:thiol-disulfide isomerase/thioredoxin